jgi:hypothetical protein
VYDVGAPPAPADHDRFTKFPTTTGAFSVGAPGAMGPATTTCTSLVGALVPPALVARMRTYQVPGGMPATPALAGDAGKTSVASGVAKPGVWPAMST